ncbi:exosortase F system-associated membrane protein [Marixanthomonas ophiurae]|uniref:Exosortase F system-associated protein n=1 Tax=Marixanthomonas ophiurae TaxID=387659 RepID=A0A3E1QBZ1_9FLAO|nr:exosortase F system-associated protein [Marixanthomonas ophiurae]RFN59665.1 exosortase F system-associated protein [Marixanthomonas ophiurae]
MNKKATILFILIAIFALVGVRFFEENIFYDPLIHFFKSDYANQTLPDFDTFKLLVSIGFRYVLNTLFSLVIIWLVFEKKDILKLSIILYLILFLLLLIVYLLLLFNYEEGNYLTLFYVRRFLIQPLFLLIFLPAFYFQKKA